MFEKPDRSSLQASAGFLCNLARSGRADAEFAIGMLGSKSRMQVPTETVLHFGQWLGWPDWLRDGTTLTGSGPLPPTVPLGEGLIMIGNILDNSDYFALFERILMSPRPVMGNVAALQLLHAPDMGTGLRSLVRAVATPNPWLLCWLIANDDTAEIAVQPPWPMGPLFEYSALGGAPLFYRAIETYRPDLLAEMVWETKFYDDPRAQRLLAGFHCRVAPSTGVERLRFPAAWLATPNPHHDPILWGVACAKLHALLLEIGEPTRVADIRTFIVQKLERERRVPRLKQAAAHLGMSMRSIVRLLAGQKTSFRKLVEEERKARALALLADTSLSLAEVADALGFSDMSSFGRSVRTWFGDTPGNLRKQPAQTDV